MTELNLQERTCCATSIGEIFATKFPSIKEALMTSTDIGEIREIGEIGVSASYNSYNSYNSTKAHPSTDNGQAEPQPNTLGVPDGTV